MGVEDVGVIRAVHHLAAVFLVFVTPAAVGPMGFGSMAIRHSVTCVAHDDASLFTAQLGREGGL